MDGTEVITLGRVLGSALQPSLTMQWLRPQVATPQEPQNLPRPTLQNGPTVPSALAGRVVENLSLGNVYKVMGMLGQGEAAAPYTPPTDALAPPAGSAQQELARFSTTAMKVGFALGALSAAASAYHGYKRNNSLGWAIAWAAAGGFFPLITPAIGLAQGWGKRKQR